MQDQAQDINNRNQPADVGSDRKNPLEPFQNISEELLEDKTVDSEETYPNEPEIPFEKQKRFDLDQMEAYALATALTDILDTVSLTPYQKTRILQARNWFMLDEGLVDFIPRPPQPQQPVTPPVQRPTPQQVQQFEEEIDRNMDVNPRLEYPGQGNDKADLDAISKKMSDINSKEGLMAKQEPEPEQTGIKKLLGGLGKKQVPERKIDEKHQTESMG
jgi:hypothetical protein